MTDVDPSDLEKLVALLDGEIEPGEAAALTARLAGEPALRDALVRLEEGGRGIDGSLGLLLGAAPIDRLDDLLDGAIEAAATAPERPRPQRSRLGSIGAAIWRPALTAAVSGALGIWIGYAVLGNPPPPPETWRQAVAEYWRLTTPDTLALEPMPEMASRELKLVADKLGLPLTLQSVTLPDAAFRGAQIFDFQGRPLTQIAYLDRESGPIAFCVIADPSRKETPPTAITMEGFTVVHWASGGYARMLIGHAPKETLQRYAEVLIAKSG